MGENLWVHEKECEALHNPQAYDLGFLVNEIQISLLRLKQILDNK